jgi:hypothetical protein
MKVTLYVREHGTRRCRKAKPERTYPMGTIWVLRYGSTWETLPPNLNSIEAVAAKMRKEIALLTGGVGAIVGGLPLTALLFLLFRASWKGNDDSGVPPS